MAEANTVTTPYTSGQGVSQDQLTNLANEINTGYNDIPSVRQSIATEVANTEGMLKPLQDSKAAMIQKLFEHDQNYAKSYSDKTSANFIENPMARSAGLDAEQAPIWNALSSLSQDIATRRAFLGSSISNAVEAQKTKLAGKQNQLDTLMNLFKEQNAQKQFDASGNSIVDVGGRKLVIDRQGNTVKDLGPATPKEPTVAEQQLARINELKSDAKLGMEFKDVMQKYGGAIDAQNILELYNANSKYGPLQATTEEVNKKYGTKLALTGAEQKRLDKQFDLENKKQEEVNKANSLIDAVEQMSEGLSYGPNPLNGILKTPAGQFINKPAYTYETGRESLAMQIATQALGSEKRVSENERKAILDLIPSIDDLPETRSLKLKNLRTRVNTMMGKKVEGNTVDPLGIL